jgi:pilin isopeptide linkage protein
MESTTAPTETTEPIAPTEPTEATTKPTESVTEPTESVTVPTTPTAPEQAPGNLIPDDAENIYKVTFMNVYEPGKASVAFGGTKKLFGRELDESEFAFLLYRTGDDFVIAENTEPLQQVRNDEEGLFNFESIAFGKVGEYHFVILEDNSDELGGVIYDTSRYLITVTVSDYHGILKAKYSVSDAYGNKSDIVFRNEYRAAAVSLPITGRKVLEDMELKEGMFRFSLYAADEKFGAIGNSLETVTHDADGVFTFKKLEFLKAGVYRYIVREDLSRQIENIAYDHSVYGVTVTVTDDGSGVLTPGVHIRLLGGTDADQIVFTNKYVAPETTAPTETEATETTAPTVPTVPPTSVPEPDGPPTGDETKLGMYVLSAMLSGFALITLWYLRKRKFCKK